MNPTMNSIAELAAGDLTITYDGAHATFTLAARDGDVYEGGCTHDMFAECLGLTRISAANIKLMLDAWPDLVYEHGFNWLKFEINIGRETHSMKSMLTKRVTKPSAIKANARDFQMRDMQRYMVAAIALFLVWSVVGHDRSRWIMRMIALAIGSIFLALFEDRARVVQAIVACMLCADLLDTSIDAILRAVR